MSAGGTYRGIPLHGRILRIRGTSSPRDGRGSAERPESLRCLSSGAQRMILFLSTQAFLKRRLPLRKATIILHQSIRRCLPLQHLLLMRRQDLRPLPLHLRYQSQLLSRLIHILPRLRVSLLPCMIISTSPYPCTFLTSASIRSPEI